MSSTLFEAVAHVTSLGQLAYSWAGHRQAERLHEAAIAADVSTHFQSLSQELYISAKEADRDVWEQHNERFINLTILAVLALSMSVALVTEGTFTDSDEDNDVTRALFILFTSMSHASLFVCLAASYRATRNMSQFMSARSASLSARIHQLVNQEILSPGVQSIFGPGGPIPSRRQLTEEILCDKQRELDAAAQKNEGKAASAPLHPPAPPQLRFADFFELNCKWLEHLAGIPIGGSSPGPADCLLIGYARAPARLGTVATFAAGVVLTSMAMGVLYADLRLEPR